MTEAPAVMWFDIDGELSSVQPATVKLNPHLMFAIASGNLILKLSLTRLAVN